MKDNLNKKIQYVDLYRCLGILLMIGGHIEFGEFGSVYSKYIHSFNIPMFFIATGLFIEKRIQTFHY